MSWEHLAANLAQLAREEANPALVLGAQAIYHALLLDHDVAEARESMNLLSALIRQWMTNSGSLASPSAAPAPATARSTGGGKSFRLPTTAPSAASAAAPAPASGAASASATEGEQEVAVDTECKIPGFDKLRVFKDGTGAFACQLVQVNIGTNNHKFFIIQVLEEEQRREWYLWARWGRVGQTGQTSLQTFSNPAKAIGTFLVKFKDKTGNHWTSLSDFKALKGKYDLVSPARSGPPRKGGTAAAAAAPAAALLKGSGGATGASMSVAVAGPTGTPVPGGYSGLVDASCGLRNARVYSDGTSVYNCTLHSTPATNKSPALLCVLQVLEADSRWYLFSRRGKVEQRFQDTATLKPFSDPALAIAEFLEEFESKTKSNWSNRASITPGAGRYAPVPGSFF